MRQSINAALMLLLLGLLSAVGCGSKSTPKTNKEQDRWQRYSKLAGLSISHAPELRAERERLIQLQQTPDQLQSQHRGTGQAKVIEEWLKVFPKQTRGMILRRTAKLFPACLTDHTLMQAAIKHRRRYDKKRTAIHQALRNPGFVLPILHDQGWLAQTQYLDVVLIAVRLEGLLAAEYLQRKQIDDAIRSLRTMWHWSDRLADQTHLISRLAAASMKKEILAVVSATANHPQATQISHTQLAEILELQIKNWPHDRRAWIGDQSDGLIAYELIRDGYLLSVLSDEEMKKMKNGPGIKSWVTSISRSIDTDQSFYLAAMTKVIKACDQPYYARQTVLTQIEQELTDLVGKKGYPFVAGQVLLTDLQIGQRHQAADRARCEAWALALGRISNRPTIGITTNPLTGKPFEVKHARGRLTVTVFGEERIHVPHRMAAAAERSSIE